MIKYLSLKAYSFKYALTTCSITDKVHSLQCIHSFIHCIYLLRFFAVMTVDQPLLNFLDFF